MIGAAAGIMLMLAGGAPGEGAPVHGRWPEVEQERVEREARGNCADQFPDSYSMQRTCLEMSREGAALFRDILARSADDPVMLRALTKCLRDLRRNGALDFTLIGVCAEVEQEARDDLRR